MTINNKKEVTMNLLGSYIADFLRIHNITQTDLARRMGKSRATINNWITNRNRLDSVDFCQLAKIIAVERGMSIAVVLFEMHVCLIGGAHE